MKHTLLPSEIEGMLKEDVPYFDLTSSLVNLGDIDAEITFTPKHDLTVCGSEEGAALFRMLGAEPILHVASGTDVPERETVLSARGNAEQLHMGWKVAQNILEHFSGIATRTRAMVEGANRGKQGTEVCGTRKHLPGVKKLSLKALCAGGGYPHRLGVSDSVLLFSNHYELLGGLAAVCSNLAEIKQKCPEKKVAVEVEGLEDAMLAARAGADIIQVDKLPPASIAAIVTAVRNACPSAVIAAAGGINSQNAEAYAAAGADVLVSSWMYFGKPADYKVVVKKI